MFFAKNKIDFFKSYNKSQRRTSYNGKEINTRRRYSITFPNEYKRELINIALEKTYDFLFPQK